MKKYVAKKDIDNYLDKKLEEAKLKTSKNEINTIWEKSVVYHTHFVDCKKTRKNNKIYNLKYKNIIKNDIYK